jgi:hypothetical protein
MFKIQLLYPKLKINVYFIFLNIGDLTFGITLVHGLAAVVSACLELFARNRTDRPDTEVSPPSLPTP